MDDTKGQLESILKRMQEQIEPELWDSPRRQTDWEGTHLEADDLLEETIKILSTAIGYEKLGEEILAAYGKVGKWYA